MSRIPASSHSWAAPHQPSLSLSSDGPDAGAALEVWESRRRIERSAYRMARNRADAEDAASHGILAALEKIAKHHEFETGPAQYASTCAWNKAKRDQERGARFDRAVDVHQRDEEGLLTSPESETPDQALACAELLQVVIHTIQDLPPVQREVVRMRVLDQATPVDIAEAIGISRGAVDSAYHRGIATLRIAVRAYLEGAPVPVSLSRSGIPGLLVA